MQRNIRPNPFYLCIIKGKSLHRERSASVPTPPNPASTNGRIQGSSGGWWNFINEGVKTSVKDSPEGRLEGANR